MNKRIKPFIYLSAGVLGALMFFVNQKFLAAETDWQTLTQIHIKAFFFEYSNSIGDVVPELLQFDRSTNKYRVLTDVGFHKVLNTIASRRNFKIVGEPEVVQTDSRETQLRATQIMSFWHADIDPRALVPPGVETTNDIIKKSDSNFIEFGPVLKATPRIMTNGFTIRLNLNLTGLELLGFGDHFGKINYSDYWKTDSDDCWKTNVADVYVSGQMQKVSFKVPDYRFKTNAVQFVGVDLFDHQTVAFVVSYVGNNHLLVFVTATIVDPAGNRIHSDEEIFFTTNSIPAQP